MTKTALPSPETSSKEMHLQSKEISYTVVKRNGTLVPFRKERIYRAIEAAFRDARRVGKVEELPSDLFSAIEDVTNQVVKQLSTLASKGACLTVEGIQDVAEVTLMKMGYHDVARGYIIYRDQHKALREDSPQTLKIARYDGTIVRFNPMKIARDFEEAFRRSRHIEGPSPDEVIDAVNLLTQKVVARAVALSKAGTSLHVSMIQDEIEQQLMREGFFLIAKEYILFRSQQGEATNKAPSIEDEVSFEQRQFSIVKEDKSSGIITESQLRAKFKFACRGLEDRVSATDLMQQAITNFYEGMKESEVDLASMFAARSKIEFEPAYSLVASRLLLDSLYRESFLTRADDPQLEMKHRDYFKKYIKHAISLQRVHSSLLEFDFDTLGAAMKLERDDQFSYLGLQTLYDRYFIHENGRRMETPQIFWMRVAMGLALTENEQKNERAIEFYNVLSQFFFVSGTPTLFNSGTVTSQLSSCYLSTVMDDLGHIFKTISDDAQLSKWAGGLGNDWSNVRATGASIKGTNGKSQGVIPFLKVANDTAVAVNQCFAPETSIYTAKGIKPIREVYPGELVLGISGKYREVTERFTYDQKDPMVRISVKHALEPIEVTSGHPFYVIRGIPMEQSIERSLEWLRKDKVKCEWVDAGQLQPGDYLAQVIPTEIVPVPGFSEEDARLYGILLGDGHLTKEGLEWGVSGNPETDEHLEFVRSYLTSKGIHFWETSRGKTYAQVRWSAGRGLLRNATNGQYISGEEGVLPFDSEDLYDAQRKKHIAPRLAHLPHSQTLSLIRGLLETDGNVSREKEITFTNVSKPLIEGLRYQLLRLGIPSAGKFRLRKNSHKGKRSDGSEAVFEGETESCDLRIPAVDSLAKSVGCRPLTKKNWMTVGNYLFTRIKKVESTPVTPFVIDLKVDTDESYMTTSGLTHNGGKRKGAMCAYLETWHLDIEDFLELRKNTGDERRRTHDMNTANWIPDLFMKRVAAGGMWTLFSPSDVPDLHDLYGLAFERRYQEYEKMVDQGKIKLFKQIEALQLWRKMLSMLFETGHPWITFKDPSNVRSPQDHVGVVHSSNLCTEILLNTSAEETAVCNLGSLNLAQLTTEKGLDEKKLASTIRTAIRMLDNVIDINFYPTPEAKTANMRHRPIGLGLMGFQDALYIQNISYASHDAVLFADRCMELISYHAILSSSELAKERGPYPTYKGSKWDRGLLPMDTIEVLEKERGQPIEMDKSASLNWQPIRDSIKKYGMRNSNTMAIAPTATIANITGPTQSIEPMYKHLFVKSNLSGEFTVTNVHLVERLKKLGLWDQEMLDDLKYFDGSINEIERIPEDIKRVFLTAFEVDPEWIIECASRRQKWIDMGQSLNLYLSEPSGKKLHQMYLDAWNKGLKTCYYLRTLAATQIEKSTTDINKRGLQPRWMKNKSASSNIQLNREEDLKEESPNKKPKPISCSLEEGCESCQ